MKSKPVQRPCLNLSPTYQEANVKDIFHSLAEGIGVESKVEEAAVLFIKPIQVLDPPKVRGELTYRLDSSTYCVQAIKHHFNALCSWVFIILDLVILPIRSISIEKQYLHPCTCTMSGRVSTPRSSAFCLACRCTTFFVVSMAKGPSLSTTQSL